MRGSRIFSHGKLYATEECEGGARAVGGDVPGIARKELSVFSQAERETAKRATIFDTWVAEARTAGR
jgi:hypothetical protein